MLIHLAFGDTGVRVDTILCVSMAFHEYRPTSHGHCTRLGNKGHTTKSTHEHC